VRIRARVENSEGNHQVVLTTGDNTYSIDIPPRPTGFGSSNLVPAPLGCVWKPR
jgi:hypothetical protein